MVFLIYSIKMAISRSVEFLQEQVNNFYFNFILFCHNYNVYIKDSILLKQVTWSNNRKEYNRTILSHKQYLDYYQIVK